MLTKFEDFKLQSRHGIEIDRTQSSKYPGMKLDEKWSWKPHIKDLFRKLGHRPPVFSRINHMLDHKSRVAYFNGLVLPHLVYADVVWGDQVSVKSEMEQLQAFHNRFAKKIQGGKQSSSNALKSLKWIPLTGRRFSHRCISVHNAIKGNIPEHFECYRSISSNSHGYNTRNGQLPRLPKPRIPNGARGQPIIGQQMIGRHFQVP